MTFIALVMIAIATGFLTHSIAMCFLTLGGGMLFVLLVNAILRAVRYRK